MIRLNGIEKKYHEGMPGEVYALRGITMEIPRGEMAAIMGPSGSGKSTLLNIIGCMDPMTSGEYFFEGEDIAKASAARLAEIRNRKIGFVFQNYGLLTDRTVEENILVPLLFSKEPLRKTRARIGEVLEMLRIEDLKKRPAAQLSGGQAQRVAIARAMVNQPQLILADEPTGALDTETAGEVMEILRDLNRAGKTLLIVTHNPAVAEICRRTYRIEDGLLKESR